jgi:hypothetical protein
LAAPATVPRAAWAGTSPVDRRADAGARAWPARPRRRRILRPPADVDADTAAAAATGDGRAQRVEEETPQAPFLT